MCCINGCKHQIQQPCFLLSFSQLIIVCMSVWLCTLLGKKWTWTKQHWWVAKWLDVYIITVHPTDDWSVEVAACLYYTVPHHWWLELWRSWMSILYSTSQLMTGVVKWWSGWMSMLYSSSSLMTGVVKWMDVYIIQYLTTDDWSGVMNWVIV